MLLAIDVGNTEITLGLFQEETLIFQWRMTTGTDRTPDEWRVTVGSHLAHTAHSYGDIAGVVLASVVPSVTQPLMDGLKDGAGVTPVAVGAHSNLPITLDVEEPMTVGADRVVNTLAASRLYGCDTIVVDFGTATTFDCITGDGRFIGGVIAPGVRTAADQLTLRTAKLPATDLQPPDRTIGRRTEECVRSGIVFGAVEAVDGIVRRIKAEWPGSQTPKVVGTGGLASSLADLSDQIEMVEPALTLIGLRMAAEHLGLGT